MDENYMFAFILKWANKHIHKWVRTIRKPLSLRSKRFRAVSEQRKTEERDSRFWPREKWNESQKIFARSFLRNSKETLATQARHLFDSSFTRVEEFFFFLVYDTEFDVFAKSFIRVAVAGNQYLIRSHFNQEQEVQRLLQSWFKTTYIVFYNHISAGHTSLLQVYRWFIPSRWYKVGGEVGSYPSPEFLIRCSISKWLCL